MHFFENLDRKGIKKLLQLVKSKLFNIDVVLAM